MKYRKLGKTGLMVSELALGCEYVWHSDEKDVVDLVHAAIDAGINYIDIFVGTPSTRDYFGRALKGIREKVILAGHFGCIDINKQYVRTRDMKLCEDFIQQFYTRLQTDYIDILFLHNCDEENDFNLIFEGEMYRRALELKNEGKAKFIGFSTHNTKIALKAVKSGKIDVLMFPVNPLFNHMPRDTGMEKLFNLEIDGARSEEEKSNYPTKQELYEECITREIGIIAMKPFAAGNVLKNYEGGVLQGLISLTPVQCISYVLDQNQATIALPGFKNVKELNESLAYFTATDEEKDYKKELENSDVYKFKNQCMYCNHCQPCPNKIDIAEVTKLKDMAEKEMTDEIESRYLALEANAGDCLFCGACSKRCPFGIDVSKNMKRALELFA
ncbi:aldo/keto reductase [Mobilitalea sibirica]|uniref:Aldo/keto reductase n=1 Tax=Mobilitalea sibirica TaxID=1462919 RepID=A0A8J7KW00_9FIRM|nr:aldo/keto reductase [Mobilitalea sibirica]MBH1940765.1 aldo/keto reductase [Mobilitalea sibirica]